MQSIARIDSATDQNGGRLVVRATHWVWPETPETWVRVRDSIANFLILGPDLIAGNQPELATWFQ